MKLKRQVKSAMFYPIAHPGRRDRRDRVMLIKVIPTFEKMFKDFGDAQAAGADAGRHQHLARFVNHWYLYRRRR